MRSNYLIIAGVLAFVFFLYKSKKKKDENSLTSKKTFTENDAKNAIIKLKNKYGTDWARIVEKIMRWETGHFKSGQYKKTGSAGMEVGKWSNLPQDKISGTIKMDDGDKDGIDTFYIWKDVYSFAEYLLNYIKRHNGNWARWYSIDPEMQSQYRDKVNSVKNRFV